MNDQELLEVLTDIESDRVERKASLAEPDRIREAICAFANDMPNHRLPGVVFVGVNDNGTCANYAITDQLLRNLSDMRSDGNTLPFPSIVVEKKTLNGCELAVVIVQPSYDPPVRFRGRTWIRVGPRRAIATAEEERRLMEKRRANNLPFDLTAIESASMEDLDLDLFRRTYLPSALAPDIIEENNRSVEDQLSSLRFITAEQDIARRRATVLGILVSGKDPREYIPGAYVQFLRIDGTDLTDLIKNQREISGPLPELLGIRRHSSSKYLSCHGRNFRCRRGTPPRLPDCGFTADYSQCCTASNLRRDKFTNAYHLVQRSDRNSKSRRTFWTSNSRKLRHAWYYRLPKPPSC